MKSRPPERPPTASTRWIAKGALLAAVCVFGCGPSPSGEECTGEEELCGEVCVDLSADTQNCGACGVVCDGAESCTGGECVAVQVCSPGTSEDCYDGPGGTEGVGPCMAGTRTCGQDGLWGPCQGMVTPVSETCGNAIDDDCNGTVDDEMDADGDGWTNCQGDCCDVAGTGCADPGLVNPGAFEVAGNEVDDDCDGTVDNQLQACDSGLQSNSNDGMDYARAMDLCQTTVENPPDNERRWGVISAEFSRADGNGTPAAASRAIRAGFGSTPVQFGNALTVLSTGHAADANDQNPAYAPFQGGQDMGTSSGVPSDWLAANNDNFPNAPGCPDPQGGTTGNDPIMLKLRIRVPTNANSFSLSSNFFSSEYPEWVCSPFNDFLVILLDSTFNGQPQNPVDKNLARYTAPDQSVYPVGVNLAYGNTGLFQVCLNGPTGCGSGSIAGNVNSCTGTGELGGTGFDVPNPPTQFADEPAWCGNSNLAGGGTGWLTTSGNVVPGEIIELRFAVWDTGDQWYDSAVLFDNFAWSVEASEPGTVVID